MNKIYIILIVTFLTVASLAAFGRIVDNDFINFDDNIYITVNNHIKTGINPESIRWAFQSFTSKNWHPLTWLSLMLDHSIFGMNPRGYHFVNLLLHIGSVLFLFLFLNKTTKSSWSAAFAAAFFALHPIRVESVAWAAERKDVLGMCFGMMSLYAYSFYAASLKISHYVICLILFALSLLSKSMLVTLPCIFLLVDYWPLGRWKTTFENIKKGQMMPCNLLIEKTPFFFLMIASSCMTVWAQYEADIPRYEFSLRLSNAIVSYVVYLKKILLPINLSVLYPFPLSLPMWQPLVAGVILLGITVWVICFIKITPFLFVGWAWYLGALVPVIGLVPVNVPMADHFTYLPSIGIAIIISWGVPLLFPRDGIRKKILIPGAIIILSVLFSLTYRQCGYWQDSITLFSHAIGVTKGNYRAYSIRGNAYNAIGKYQQSITDSTEAIRHNPYDAEAYCERGISYTKLGKYQEAIEEFNKGILINKDKNVCYGNRGNVYYARGEYDMAIADYNEAVRLKPDNAEGYDNRGNTHAKLKQYEQAIIDYNKAVLLKPDYAEVYYNRGTLYAERGQYKLAVEDYNKTLALNNHYVKACNNRGAVYYKLGQYQQAISDYNQAIRLNSAYAEAYHNRALAFFKTDKEELGCRDIQRACKLGHCKLIKKYNAICKGF